MSLTGSLASASLKSLIDAPRPAALIQEPGALYVIGETLTTRAMPSGHALTIGAVVGALCAMVAIERAPLSASDRRLGYPAGKESLPRSAEGSLLASAPGSLLERAWILPLSGLIMLGVGLARIASGAHWPADVLVGSGLGLSIGFVSGVFGVALGEGRLGEGRWGEARLGEGRFGEGAARAALALERLAKALIAFALLWMSFPPSISEETARALGIVLALFLLLSLRAERSARLR